MSAPGREVSQDDEGSAGFEQSFAELIDAEADRRDKAAFEAFYRRFVPRLVGFLICQGAGLQVAADIAQETMIKAWRGWSRIDFPEPWARRTASRALIRHLIDDRETPTGPVPDSTLITNPDVIGEFESRHVIIPLVRRLPTRQRQVLAWTLAGDTPSEIAGELGLTPEAVRASLKVARRKIAQMLDVEGETDGQ